MAALSRVPASAWIATAVVAFALAALIPSVSSSSPPESPGGGSPPPAAVADPAASAVVRLALGIHDGAPLAAGLPPAANLGAQAAIDTFAATQAGTLAPLVAEQQAAHEEIAHALANRLDAGAPRARLAAARQALRTAATTVAGDIRTALASADTTELAAPSGSAEQSTPTAAALFDRAVAQSDLDPDLHLLNLTGPQLAAIRAAQQTRDTITTDARNWHKPATLAAARAAYESALAEVLDQSQATARAAARTLIASAGSEQG